jgi:2-polyprenyl-3-methyl-5-hydroxy-6-metoxy-1,4-benzoquinol methylase
MIPTSRLWKCMARLGSWNLSTAGWGDTRPRMPESGSCCPPEGGKLTLLDIGTGAGDVPRHLWSRFHKKELEFNAHAIDLNPHAIDYAKQHQYPVGGVTYEVQDIFSLPHDRLYDIVHSALFLHHFTDNEILQLVGKMLSLSRRGVIINDLHRHPIAYYSILLLSRILSRSRLIRHDAPLSVLRAFRRSDLEKIMQRLQITRYEIHWLWAFRWQVVIYKDDE